MPTLELIEENSSTCPVTTSTGGGIPLLLLGAVGVIAVVGMMYATSGKTTGDGIKPEEAM